MPTLHAMEAIAWSPMATPLSSPRTVSATGVNGWYSANWRRPIGMVAMDTKPLLRNSSSNRIIGVLLAVSTLFAANPSATASQISAKANRASIPIAASHSNGPALEWNPRPKATPTRMAIAARVCGRWPSCGTGR
jgi:hypothetical protein